jgi:hypothetical protein
VRHQELRLVKCFNIETHSERKHLLVIRKVTNLMTAGERGEAGFWSQRPSIPGQSSVCTCSAYSSSGSQDFCNSSYQKPIKMSTQICWSGCWCLTNWWFTITFFFPINSKKWNFQWYFINNKEVIFAYFNIFLKSWRFEIKCADFGIALLSLKCNSLKCFFPSFLVVSLCVLNCYSCTEKCNIEWHSGN